MKTEWFWKQNKKERTSLQVFDAAKCMPWNVGYEGWYTAVYSTSMKNILFDLKWTFIILYSQH